MVSVDKMQTAHDENQAVLFQYGGNPITVLFNMEWVKFFSETTQ